jgi:hypothetical protein
MNDSSETSVRALLQQNGIADRDITKYLAWVKRVGGAPRTQLVPLEPPIRRRIRYEIDELLRGRHFVA